MATAKKQDDVLNGQDVYVSNTATNMILSLYPFDKKRADAALTKIKSSVLDKAKIRKMVGVDNAFVARADDLQVLFRTEGDAIVITSVVAHA